MRQEGGKRRRRATGVLVPLLQLQSSLFPTTNDNSMSLRPGHRGAEGRHESFWRQSPASDLHPQQNSSEHTHTHIPLISTNSSTRVYSSGSMTITPSLGLGASCFGAKPCIPKNVLSTPNQTPTTHTTATITD